METKQITHKIETHNLPSEDTQFKYPPEILRKAFTEELDDSGSRDHAPIVTAIHAILLESGFVRFDPVSRMEVNGSQFRNDRRSLYYTLPVMINDAKMSVDTVVVKYNKLSKYMTVYASLLIHKSVVHRLTLDVHKLMPLLKGAWLNCGVSSSTCVEKEVFEFWRSVKDGLALPLMIDLCENAGLYLPPCFTRLSADLKLKILGCLDFKDAAKLSCVSTELRYLWRVNLLWKEKQAKKFWGTGYQARYWKQKFLNRRLRFNRVRPNDYNNPCNLSSMFKILQM